MFKLHEHDLSGYIYILNYEHEKFFRGRAWSQLGPANSEALLYITVVTQIRGCGGVKNVTHALSDVTVVCKKVHRSGVNCEKLFSF